MATPIRILLQTTIPVTEDDWSIRRYSLLRDYLASLMDARGEPLPAVTARDREPDARGHDPGLSGLAGSDFDEIWLFADYNWDPDAGCPSFVEEAPGDGMKRKPRARADIQAYVRNAALWLVGERSG